MDWTRLTVAFETEFCIVIPSIDYSLLFSLPVVSSGHPHIVDSLFMSALRLSLSVSSC